MSKRYNAYKLFLIMIMLIFIFCNNTINRTKEIQPIFTISADRTVIDRYVKDKEFADFLEEDRIYITIDPNIDAIVGLSIQNRYIKVLPQGLWDLKYLRSLNLKGNRIVELPEIIRDLKKLHSLDVSNNKLTQLPQSIGNLINLGSLDVSNNKLTQLPQNIGNLTNLEYLYFYNNYITFIPKEFSKLKKLKQIGLYGNSIRILPTSLQAIKNLECILYEDKSNLKKCEKGHGDIRTLFEQYFLRRMHVKLKWVED